MMSLELRIRLKSGNSIHKKRRRKQGLLADFLPPSSWERRERRIRIRKENASQEVTTQNNRRKTNQKMANLTRGCANGDLLFLTAVKDQEFLGDAGSWVLTWN